MTRRAADGQSPAERAEKLDVLLLEVRLHDLDQLPLAAASPAAVPWSPPVPPHSASQYDFFQTRRFASRGSRRSAAPTIPAHAAACPSRRRRGTRRSGALCGGRARRDRARGGGEMPRRPSSKELRRSLIRAAFCPRRPASSTARPHSAATKASAHTPRASPSGTCPGTRRRREHRRRGPRPWPGASSTTRRAGGGGGGSTSAGFAGRAWRARAENFWEAGAFPPSCCSR